ncbi:MAG: polysaccharide biosynthesis C-terminal domain-containing protein [Clostridia bacterium]|nr:polysaccharide biosynthesis C-terminal domain-containing protein [Clostridia bacterium]
MTENKSKSGSAAFIKDGLLLTFATLALRSAGIFFSSRLSVIAGTAVLGLYTQIMSVYAFAATAATAGVNLGALRITAESYGRGDLDCIRPGMREAIKYCLKVGLFTCIMLAVNSRLFGTALLRDARTVSSLQALAFALPFISVANAFHGYFNGIKRIYKSIAVSFCEQAARISLTLYTLTRLEGASTELMCLTLVACNVISEIISCLLLAALYLFDSRRYPVATANKLLLKKRFTGITLPLAVSALIRSGLTSAEHILIPIGLRASGESGDSAMSKYGIVSGMVMPILLFPMALLSSFASITVTNLSSRISACESGSSISRTVSKGISLSLKYAIGEAMIIHYFAPALASSIYASAEAGQYLRIMAPLVFLMYLDHISDGMLKGLDKQNYVMKVNIIDASLSVIFAVILIPRLGIYGFIASVYICEFLNCICSFGMLMRSLPLRFSITENILAPVSTASASVYISALMIGNSIFSVILSAILFLVLQILPYFFRTFSRNTFSGKCSVHDKRVGKGVLAFQSDGNVLLALADKKHDRPA